MDLSLADATDYPPCNVCVGGEVFVDLTLQIPVCLDCGALSTNASSLNLVDPAHYEVNCPQTSSFDDNLRQPSRCEKRLRSHVSDALSHHGIIRMPLRLRKFVKNVASLYKDGAKERTLKAAAAAVVLLEVGREKQLTISEVGIVSGVEAQCVRKEYIKISTALGSGVEERRVTVRGFLRRAVRIVANGGDFGNSGNLKMLMQLAEKVAKVVERAGRIEGLNPMRVALAIAIVSEEVTLKRRRVGGWDVVENVGCSVGAVRKEVKVVHGLLFQELKKSLLWPDLTKNNMMEYAYLHLNMIKSEEGHVELAPQCFRDSEAKKVERRAVIDEAKKRVKGGKQQNSQEGDNTEGGKEILPSGILKEEVEIVRKLCEAGASDKELMSGHYESVAEKYRDKDETEEYKKTEDCDGMVVNSPKESLARAALLNAIIRKMQDRRPKNASTKGTKRESSNHRTTNAGIVKRVVEQRGPSNKINTSAVEALERENGKSVVDTEVYKAVDFRHDLFQIPNLL
eukprot:Plantae.Rhodophyta-Hildenbrandia_rubra.ctg9371.p1 GENE.Plantae.Rhodophyta-Hildenbrandia_rubra.ctg9371~~Plantae.Rhodophyta-Hildenbrandia_rubra.ctg9371.p1  ORF type:complete len:512 (-),score=112.36 Plantae.Rhodophyta-Hildenbrandia_rubra.ctg9371:64-1599(-)